MEVDAVPYADPANYVRYSGRLADELNASEPAGAVWANQFDNLANRAAHAQTTGPEIWAQTGGKVDGFICAVGSGGALAGVAEALRERNPAVAIGLAFAPRLAAALGRVDPSEIVRHDEVLLALGLQSRIPAHFPTSSLLEAMGHDKKAHHDFTFVLGGAAGFETVHGVDPELVHDVLERFQGEP